MFLNKSHPQFSLEMELLCSLPIRIDREGIECAASLSDLADDLGLSVHREVQVLADKLKDKMGINIERYTAENIGRALAIMPDSWEQARAIANSYFETVYRGKPVLSA